MKAIRHSKTLPPHRGPHAAPDLRQGRRPCDLVEMPAVLRAAVDAREAA